MRGQVLVQPRLAVGVAEQLRPQQQQTRGQHGDFEQGYEIDRYCSKQSWRGFLTVKTLRRFLLFLIFTMISLGLHIRHLTFTYFFVKFVNLHMFC